MSTVRSDLAKPTHIRGISTTILQEYLTRYGDLKKAYGDDLQKAADHWFKYGIKEGRSLSNQSSATSISGISTSSLQSYLNQYGDLKKAYGDDLKKAADHWYRFGISEGRIMSDLAPASTTVKTPAPTTAVPKASTSLKIPILAVAGLAVLSYLLM